MKNIFILFLLQSLNLTAQDLPSMCDKIYNSIKDYKDIKLAVLDLKTIGAREQDAKIIQERITTYFSTKKDVTLIERELINKVMQEQNFQQTGAVNDNDITKIGQLLGATHILSGTINNLKENRIELNSRVIEIKTGKIITGANGVIERDWEAINISTKTPNISGKSITQIAILLDTSNSMDGLIEQTKRYIWSVINELIKYEKNGEGAMVEVALYEYGNNNIPKENGYVRKILDFTRDMDKVAKELFALKTNGGDEYCGWVIKDAVENLNWDKRDDVYKAIFIAGNEPFTQGPINYVDAINLAKSKGIFVNTIFCGSRQQGIAQRWKDGALIAEGEYNIIDQNYIANIETPYDDKIVELNNKLNQTYVVYGGAEFREKYEDKVMLDKKTLSQSKGVLAERASFASSLAPGAGGSYSSWDLITAIENGEIKINEIEKDKLPDELKKMKKEELEKYIKEKLDERKKIREDLEKNKLQRDKYIESNQNKTPDDLGKAIVDTLRKQITKKGYKRK